MNTSPSSAEMQQLLLESLDAIERLQGQLDESRRERSPPIAIIGIGCSFPGAAGPDAFWQLLADGVDAIAPIPDDRWPRERYLADAPMAGRMVVSEGGFVPHLREFDPTFFGISAREALALDPQQRLLLEVVWQTLEQAGAPAEAMRDSATGVYVGICSNDYQHLLVERGIETLDAYLSSGTSHSTAAGRISYWLGLKGPSMAIDTACSSSLVALHLARRSLQAGECEQALVAGVNRIIRPHVHVNFTQAGMLAPDGRCKAFAAEADGFVRSEGCGVVLLKRLDAAQRDGDRILAVIAGSAVNQDGRSSGLTVPCGPAQQAVIRAALDDAGLTPDALGYLEAHGTGTRLGDPIEAESLTEVFARSHAQQPLPVASVKTNIGHLEAAAGIAGVIKLVLALQHRQLPAHLHCAAASPLIDWAQAPFRLVDRLQPWEPRAGRRVAGVSSFGFSGTNAHVLLAEPPAVPVTELPASAGPLLLPLSARSPEALRLLAAAWRTRLDDPQAHVREALASVATRRDALPWRLCLLAGDPAGLCEQLIAAVPEQARPQPRIAFLFSGQGAQHASMARALAAADAGFAADLEALCALAREATGLELAPLLDEDRDQRLDDTRFAQPALCALQLALVRTLARHRVQPAVVLGHSVGEIAAACAAGLFDEATALRFAAARGAAMSEHAGAGAMLALIGPDRSGIERLQAQHPALDLAAANAPDCHVLAGPVAALEALAGDCVAQGIAHSRLRSTRAFHSRQMDAALPAVAAAAGVACGRARRVWIDSVDGAVRQTVDVDYWRRQARAPVDFCAALQALREQRIDGYLELGPGRTLLSLLRRHGDSVPVFATLAGHEQPDAIPWFEALAGLFRLGVGIDWVARVGGRGPVLDLPGHPFLREPCWPDDAASGGADLPPFETALARAGLGAASPEQTELLQRLYRTLLAGQDLPTASHDGLVHQLCWPVRTDLDVPSTLLPAPAPPSQHIDQELASGGAASIDHYRQYEAALEALTADAVACVWHAAGLFDSTCSAGEIAQRLGLAEKFRPLLARLLEMLCTAGWLECRPDGWAGTGRVPAALAVRLDAFAARWGRRVEFRLLERCLRQLDGVLRGAVNPVHLLFPDGDFSETAELYRDGPVLRALNAALRRWLTQLAGTLPVDSGLRLLEVGAGTGGTTGQLLDALSGRQGEYWFTDVGASFVERARREFAANPLLRFGLFDLESGEAPIAAGSCDVVVAANVLHATRDIGASLRRAAQALKAGGWIALIEGTARQNWVDLTFGLTDGWWCFGDDPRRSDYPLLDEAGWRALLAEQGFGDIAFAEPYPGCSQRLIIARAAPIAAPTHLLFSRDPVLRTRATEALQQAGRNVLHLESCGAASQCVQGLPAGAVVQLLLDATDATPARTSCNDLAVLLAHLQDRTDLALQLVIRGEHGWQQPDAVAVAAFARVASLERGGHGVQRLWLASTSDAELQRVLCTPPGGEREARIGTDGRAVPRLQPLSIPAAAPSFPSDACYLVTGGLGGVGLEVIRWFADHGARELVLVGRAAAETDAQHAALAALAERGMRVRVCAFDLADGNAVDALIADLRAQPVALRGIVHLAAVIGEPVPAAGLPADSLSGVFAAKAEGAWHLHRATRDCALDFFVCFSSGASIWGFKGQAHYAAANGFVDGLMRARRAAGLVGTSLNWGHLAPGGMAAGADSHAQLQGYGVHAIGADEIVALLGAAIVGNAEQWVLARNDWPRLGELLAGSGEGRLLDELRAAAAIAPEPTPLPQARVDLRAQLAALPARRRAAALEDRLIGMLAAVTGGDGRRIGVEDGFQSLGVDSLLALELRRAVEAASDLALPATMIYDFPNIAALARHLLPLLDDGSSAAPVASVTDGTSSDGDLVGANLDELESLLARELDDLAGRNGAVTLT